jgi:secreted PhoX family phosphatase
MTRFNGGEGIATMGDDVWFTTKGDVRVWHYALGSGQVSLRYQGGSGTLDAVDNLWLDDASGNLFVAEDGGNMELVMLRPDNSTVAVVRIPGQDGSEVTGPCFSPDGQRLYFSSQRGPVGVLNAPLGITYEVTGPFDALLGRP